MRPGASASMPEQPFWPGARSARFDFLSRGSVIDNKAHSDVLVRFGYCVLAIQCLQCSHSVRYSFSRETKSASSVLVSGIKSMGRFGDSSAVLEGANGIRCASRSIGIENGL